MKLPLQTELQKLHIPVDLYRYIVMYLPFYSISEDRFVDQDFLFHHTENTKSKAQRNAEEYMVNPIQIILKRLFGRIKHLNKSTIVFLFPYIKIDEPEMMSILDKDLLMRKRFLGLYIPFSQCFASVKRFVHLERLVLSIGEDYTPTKETISCDTLLGMKRLNDLRIKFPLHLKDLSTIIQPTTSKLIQLSIELYSSDEHELLEQLLQKCKHLKSLHLFCLNVMEFHSEWQTFHKLQILYLDGFDLHSSHPKPFHNIKSLHLNRCTNVDSFLPCLIGELSMTHFSLRQIQKVSQVNLYVLETFLNNNSSSLQYLDLSENLNILSPRTFNLKNLASYPHLSYLNLSNSHFVDHLDKVHPLESIISWIKKCPKLLVFHFESTLSLCLTRDHVLDLLKTISKSKIEIISFPVCIVEGFFDIIEKELPIQISFEYTFWLQRK